MISRTSPAPLSDLRHLISGGLSPHRNSCFLSSNVYSSSLPYPLQKFSVNLGRTSVVMAAKKNKKNDKKHDGHSFIAKPDEATGPFPEAVLLKERKVQEDGKLLPEFADAEERELFEYLNLKLESDLNVNQMRHYEVVYLIHEDHVKEVTSVNSKVEDFLKEKKGRVWRFSDWGIRKLAYKIKKANKAHYILMNFELDAKWINDFKSLLDKDERVIRHLVIKRDEAITEDCPPPPEFHSLRAGMDDDDDEDDDDMEDDADEGETEIDSSYDDTEDGIIYVEEDEDEDDREDDTKNKYQRTAGSSNSGKRTKAGKVGSR